MICGHIPLSRQAEDLFLNSYERRKNPAATTAAYSQPGSGRTWILGLRPRLFGAGSSGENNSAHRYFKWVN